MSLSHALSQSVKISLVSHHDSRGRVIADICRLFVVTWCRSSPQFEELISSTIEETKDIPEIISETGKIGMPHKGSVSWAVHRHSVQSADDQTLHMAEIMKKIGELFLLRTNINSVGSVLDSPVSRCRHSPDLC